MGSLVAGRFFILKEGTEVEGLSNTISTGSIAGDLFGIAGLGFLTLTITLLFNILGKLFFLEIEIERISFYGYIQ